MPFLTRLTIKTSLVSLVLALLAGLQMAVAPVIGWAGIPGLRPVMFHLLAVGWLTQLIFGVAHWMFPKVSRDNPRGSDTAAWLVYGLLNAGLLLRVVGEPLSVSSASALWGWLLAASAILQLAAGWLFVANTWRRVKSR